MEWFRQRIERLRNQRGLSARALSLRIGQNPAYVQQLESGLRNKKPPGYPVLKAMADEFGLTVDELVGPDGAGRGLGRPARPQRRLEDLLERIGAEPFDPDVELEQIASAGKGTGVIQEDGGQDPPRRRRRREQYVIRVEGRCMSPDIEPGDRVVFAAGVHAEPGDLVVAVMEGERVIVKHLVERENVQLLLPLNGDPIPVDENLRIVGVVRGILKPPPPPRKRP